MAETVLGRLLRRRGVPWGTLLRWLPKAPRVGRLLVRLVADRRVPTWPKLLLGMLVVYFLSPVDLVPEIAFGPLGLADDLALAALVLRTVLQAAPPPVLAEHLTAVGLEP